MQDYDIIIIGAGPAGCAAARTLARGGWNVGMFDKAHFPREKTCGDALIPDAHLALDKLELRERVEQLSYPTKALRLISFDGSEVSVRGRTAVTPRLKLDVLLLEAAQEVGAKFLPGHDFQSVKDEDGTNYIVEFTVDGGKIEVRAPWVLLATGANAAPIARAGLLERHDPSSFAVRQYVRNPRLAKDFNELVFIFDHTVRGGYGWIFPGPDGVFNIGIGYFGSAEKNSGLRRDYEQFITHQALAKDLMSDGVVVSPLKGAPLRTGLTGTRFAEGGLLATGECVGTTFPLTGEGIGKALETGVLAAETLLAYAAQGRAAVAAAHTASMSALKPKYDAYRKSELLLRWPWLANMLVRRAGRGEYMRNRLEALFNETADPANLFKLKTWVRILLK
ncbi:Menaquinone reductase [Ferriphaselus amnicola]|uniref:Menaquinone reductase n=1 Tax=Ferriphaselus amnicola TaxID=1188319 RepID=A0A2Z6GEU1_9PROT|nr:geranylgeranyl reductase family protein [Ferriphaselus amnicola]BBE51917.1 Menaquinone reductase [Ferriphaselus amnicola]